MRKLLLAIIKLHICDAHNKFYKTCPFSEVKVTKVNSTLTLPEFIYNIAALRFAAVTKLSIKLTKQSCGTPSMIHDSSGFLIVVASKA